MKTTFTSYRIKGKGRGKTIGYPTINLAIPHDFVYPEGIYAVCVVIDNKKYQGALHWGAVPTFFETENSLEVYIINVKGVVFPTPYTRKVEVAIVKKIRAVKKFSSVEKLTEQMTSDIATIKNIFSTS